MEVDPPHLLDLRHRAHAGLLGGFPLPAAFIHVEGPGIDVSVHAIPDLPGNYNIYCTLGADKKGVCKSLIQLYASNVKIPGWKGAYTKGWVFWTWAHTCASHGKGNAGLPAFPVSPINLQ